MNINYKLFQARKNKLLYYGLKNKLIFPYPDALFDRLRPYNVGGIPASIMLHITELCNGFCYDRSLLMQLALENCQVVHADVESLRLLEGEELAEHSFIETTDFGQGKTWVIDTSVGLIFDKDFYYKIEQPKINNVYSKEQCMQNPEVISILASDFNKDKFSLPLILPIIESSIEKSNWLATSLYREKIQSELKLFKKQINYDAIKDEMYADIELSRTNPKAVDEKYGIVRDEYGNVISRKGIPNPYYKTREQTLKDNEYYESIKDNPDELRRYYVNLSKESEKRWQAEYDETSKIATKRLEEILKNPTKNFYELEQE